ncbi:hypothetical protein [Mycobacterium intermedium]|uniref:hypothetical protein n=1 Tax=Mycobacterium intermedium TaxID=28445 RepID=UPI001E347C65|nr:hypothetical protein [Mycobacterium intermedium]
MPNGRSFARQLPECGALDKFGQIPGKILQSAGSWLGGGELGSEQSQGITICLNGIDNPTLSLQAMPQLVCLIPSASHRSHALDEFQDRLPGLVAFEILENLVAVPDGGDVVQWEVEVLVDLILDVSGVHRFDDFVDVQIGHAVGRRVGGPRRAAVREQDAGEAGHLSLPAPCQSGQNVGCSRGVVHVRCARCSNFDDVDSRLPPRPFHLASWDQCAPSH